MFFVYILKSESSGKFYYGSSENPDLRLINEHNKGKVRATKSGLPWILIYQEEFATRGEAYQREHYFKTWAGRRWLKSKDIT
ncbi:MAG: GIY-YIG nuclease family protein [Bacteroidetes bacterium]|nr:GIY-YIG nuclease family protein [Bacteroidota bacterium]